MGTAHRDKSQGSRSGSGLSSIVSTSTFPNASRSIEHLLLVIGIQILSRARSCPRKPGFGKITGRISWHFFNATSAVSPMLSISHPTQIDPDLDDPAAQ